MKLHTPLGFALLLYAYILPPPAAAQSPQEPEPARFSLMVRTSPADAPSFYPLGDKEGAGSSAVIGGLRKLPSARLLGGAPVDTLALNFFRQGEAARVTVYVHRGGESARESIRVAELFVGAGRAYAVTQLTAYGVEPLVLSVVRRAGVELKPPRVENRTTAVEVAEVKVHPEVPSFELVLRNVSEKELRALEIEEYRGWQRKGPPPMYDWKAASPVKPGGTLRVTLELGWNSKAGAGGHAVEPPDRVVIGAALFKDGSHEGNSLFAARAEAFREGRRVQLGRVLGLLRETAELPGVEAAAAARELAARVALLECVAEWADVTEFAGRYALARGEELDRIKSQMEEGMRWQRSAVHYEQTSFAARDSGTPYPRAAGGWLKALLEKYERLLPGV